MVVRALVIIMVALLTGCAAYELRSIDAGASVGETEYSGDNPGTQKAFTAIGRVNFHYERK